MTPDPPDCGTALPQFDGRPLLMLNGKYDQVVTPEMADRRFAAAAEPKSLKWYNSGHHLPDRAYADAAEWVASFWNAQPQQKK